MAYLDPDSGLAGGPGFAHRLRQTMRVVIPLGILALVAALIWTFARQETGVRREAPAISTLIPIQEAPPPPPPKTPPPPEPKMETVVPQPTAQPPSPAPTPSPSASPAAPGQQAVTENAPAQAGSDAFNIGAGSGRGMSGSGNGGGGGGGGLYGSYLNGVLRAALERDPPLRGKALNILVDVWVTPEGRVQDIKLVRASGVSAYDQEIRTVLAQAALRAPPAGLPMPAHVLIDFRRPL